MWRGNDAVWAEISGSRDGDGFGRGLYSAAAFGQFFQERCQIGGNGTYQL